MGRVYRPEYTVPLPADAATRAGKRGPEARLRVRGQWLWCRLTKDGSRARVPSKNYAIEYVDASGRTRRVAGYSDKSAAEAKLGQLTRAAERARAGLPAPPDPAQSLDELLDAYRQHLLDRGCTPRHADACRQRVADCARAGDWITPADLSAESLLAYLAARQRLPARRGGCRRGPSGPVAGTGGTGFGAKSANHYLAACRAFAGWLVRTRRLAADPFADMNPFNERVDRRHRRRTLSAGDFAELLAAAAAAPSRGGLDGPVRALLYLTAARTGLRAAELHSLSVGSLRLADAPPSVIVEAKFSKHRRTDVVPLHPDLVDRLRPLASGRKSGEPLFPAGNWHRVLARLLRADLAAAGIPYALEGRVFDFHALRAQFATDLDRAGVSPAVAQRLMRLSSPALLANHYTRHDAGELSDAVGKLDLPR